MSILVRCNYATKANLKGATGIDTSMLALKTDLVSLKTKVDADLSKLSNVVDNDVEKKLCIINRLRKALLLIRYQTLVD